MNKITAIYVRRSVSDKDRGNNSLSIAAQREECIRYAQEHYPDCEYQVFCDDGKSGKDIEHRPAFMEMMCNVKDGLISRIIIKKYDRFSRDLRDFLNVSYELEKMNVGIISLNENFDTSTAYGITMRNVMMNFAELERKTIADRVADAYDTKARETGFYQGGKVYFGYQSSRQTINGKTGSVLVPSSQALAVQKAYEIYSQPDKSLNDVVDYLRSEKIPVAYENGKKKHGNLDRSHISRILESPLYVRADKEVYRYFAAKGVEMLDDISAYDGVHGLFLHGKFGGNGDMFVKVGYHEGLVNADTWLAVQDKKAHTSKFHGKHRGSNSWLVGLVKCAHCGYAFVVHHSENKSKTKSWRHYRDSGYYTTNSCVKRTPKIRPDEVESAVFEAIKERLNTLEIAKKEREKPNPEVEQITAEIINIETEINGLMEKLAFADTKLFTYIQERISKLDTKKSDLESKLQKLTRRRKEIDTAPLAEPLARWSELTVQEKRNLAGKIIEVIHVSDETGIDITFSI